MTGDRGAQSEDECVGPVPGAHTERDGEGLPLPGGVAFRLLADGTQVGCSAIIVDTVWSL